MKQQNLSTIIILLFLPLFLSTQWGISQTPTLFRPTASQVDMYAPERNSQAIYGMDGIRSTTTRAISKNGSPAWYKVNMGAIKYIHQITLHTGSPINNVYIVYSEAPISTVNLQTLLSCDWFHYVHLSNAATGTSVSINSPAQYVGIIYGNNDDHVDLDELEIETSDIFPPAELCNNGVDDDGDGLTDCKDYPCGIGYIEASVSPPTCPSCNNGSMCIFTGGANRISIDGGMTWLDVPSGSHWLCVNGLSEGDYCVKAINSNHCAMAFDDGNGKCEVSVRCPPTPPLSPLGESVLDSLEKYCDLQIPYVCGTDICLDPVLPMDCGDILSSGNSLEVLVEGPEIFGNASLMIQQAEYEIDMAFYVWEVTCEANDLIRNAFVLNEQGREADDSLLVRIMLHDAPVVGGDPIEDLAHEISTWGLDPSKWTFQYATILDWYIADGNLHDKLIIVDGKKMVVTGANIEAHHDSTDPWRDTGYKIEGEAGTQALAHFDFHWKEGESKHWECQGSDCDKADEKWPIPTRDWLPNVQFLGGSTNILYAGQVRPATNSPQNTAWVSLMDNASSHINIATPNFSSSAFIDAVVRAVNRGVHVNLISGRLFNAHQGTNWLGGGYNRESISKIRKKIRESNPTNMPNLTFKWYSYDGKQEILENAPRAMHTKYMSVDDQTAMIGSGNQDEFSWEHSYEINFVVDNASDVAAMESAFFDEDLDKSIDQVIEFYEANNVQQDIVGIENTIFDHTIDYTDYGGLFTPPFYGVNDEFRSAVIYNTPPGRRIRLFDSANGSEIQRHKDDWVEIVTKQHIDMLDINTFEQSFENDEIRVIYVSNDNLDGKVSFFQVDDYVLTPRVVFYEGNNATQNIVCVIPLEQVDGLYKFSGTYDCTNDEARSAKLIDMPVNALLKIYDNSEGSVSDDYTEIRVKREFHEKVIPTFESSFEDDDVAVTFHQHNGLDGKVSAIRNENATMPTMVLYEGNNATQDQLCTLPLENINGHYKFPGVYNCPNDEARSAILYNLQANKSLIIYDNSDGSKSDDYTEIFVKKDFDETLIASFEQSFETDKVKVTYHPHNGLDGKVSAIRNETFEPVAEFYEGYSGTQDLLCSVPLDNVSGHYEFQGIYGCDNDEAKSVILYYMSQGDFLKIFDNKSGSTSDDYLEIVVKQDFQQKMVYNLEVSYEDDDIKVIYHPDNGLNGKVSSLWNGSDLSRMAVFYEGNNATQDIVCSVPLNEVSGHYTFAGTYNCTNDEARSLKLFNMKALDKIIIYDSSNGFEDDDFFEIEIKQNFDERIINTFEQSFEDEYIKATYHAVDGLDGKVSSFKD